MRIREFIYSRFSDDHLYKLFDKYCEKLDKIDDLEKTRKIINGPVWDIWGAFIRKHDHGWYNEKLEEVLVAFDERINKYRHRY